MYPHCTLILVSVDASYFMAFLMVIYLLLKYTSQTTIHITVPTRCITQLEADVLINSLGPIADIFVMRLSAS